MYEDVIAQLKDIINYNNAQLTIDERNLLSIAYKNLTANLRASWRTIDSLQKKQALLSTRQQVKLMRVQKDQIEKDLDNLCRDVVDLLEKYLIPAASDAPEEDEGVNANVFRNLDSPVSEGGENFSTG